MSELQAWVPLLPPSSNNIYVRHPTGKGRVLSGQARRFKIRAMQAIQAEGRVAVMQFEKNMPYELRLAIFFEQVENKQSRRGDRYKRMDLSNRVKLIEDTVAEAVGLDDCHNFRELLEKHCDPDNPGIYVTLRRIPEEEVGLTKEKYDELRRSQPDRADRDGPGPGNHGHAPRHRTGSTRIDAQRPRRARRLPK